MSTIVQDPIDRNLAPATKASVWPTAAKWGAISAVVGSILTLIFYNLGMMGLDESGEAASSFVPTVVSLLLTVALLYLGMKEYKLTANGGYLSFGRGLLWSLAFGLIGGLISAVFIYLFHSVLAPELLPGILEAQLDTMAEQGVDEASIEAAETGMAYFMSPAAQAVSTILMAVIASAIIGAIVALILRSKD